MAKELIADALGCAATGSSDPVIARLKEAVARTGSTGSASVIAAPIRVGIADAVLINGAMTRVQDRNDAYVTQGAVGHPSDNVAALLAVAEDQDVSGERFLHATILCYEIYCRLIDGLPTGSPWDHTAVSAVALPLALAWMLELPRHVMEAAVCLSAAFARPSSEVRAGQLSAAKTLANAVVASCACTMTQLAASGLSGPAGAMDGPSGWLRAVAPGLDVARTFARSEHPARLKVQDVSIKAYPCIGTAQGAVAAAIHIRPTFVTRDLDALRIHVDLPDDPLVASQIRDEARWRPATRETADHSIPYLVAMALIEGEIAPRQYERRMWQDRHVRAVMDRVTLTAERGSTSLGRSGARITLAHPTQGTATFELAAAPGHPENPIRGQALYERVLRNLGEAWDRATGERILAWVQTMEEQPSTRTLAQLLAAATRDDPTTERNNGHVAQTGMASDRVSARGEMQ